MTDEYLIAMLRNNVGVSEAACRAAKAAADRIEQLVVEKDAAAAAAYEVAADRVLNVRAPMTYGEISSMIRALATPDQTAALDKLIADAEERVWEKAERVARDTGTCLMPSGHFLSERCADAILAASKKGGAA